MRAAASTPVALLAALVALSSLFLSAGLAGCALSHAGPGGEEEEVVPYISCEELRGRVEEGEPCAFEGRCVVGYDDGWMGMCGDFGFTCEEGFLVEYDARFECGPPVVDPPGADGEPCSSNGECDGGLCYGDASPDGSFSMATCRSLCLDNGDYGHYCDDDRDCCEGFCCVGCGELEGLCTRPR